MALASLLILAAALAELAGAEPSGDPSVEVVLRYRVSLAPGHFRPLAIIRDPRRELHCPSWRWIWGDEGESGVEPDCDPYEDLEARERWSVQAPRYHVFRRPGEYDITFELRSQGRTYRSTVRVIVQGESLDGMAREKGGRR